MTDEGEVRKEELLVEDRAEFWLFVFVLPLITARQSVNTATVWTRRGCWRIADTTRRVGASLTRKTTTTRNHRRMTHAPNMTCLPHKENGVEDASGVDAEGREYGGDEKVAESGKPRGEVTELPKKTERPYFSGRTHPFVAACTEVRDREPSTDGHVAESVSETKLLLRY